MDFIFFQSQVSHPTFWLLVFYTKNASNVATHRSLSVSLEDFVQLHIHVTQFRSFKNDGPCLAFVTRVVFPPVSTFARGSRVISAKMPLRVSVTDVSIPL